MRKAPCENGISITGKHGICFSLKLVSKSFMQVPFKWIQLDLKTIFYYWQYKSYYYFRCVSFCLLFSLFSSHDWKKSNRTLFPLQILPTHSKITLNILSNTLWLRIVLGDHMMIKSGISLQKKSMQIIFKLHPVRVSHEMLRRAPATTALCAGRTVPDGPSLAFEPGSQLTGSSDTPACQEPTVAYGTQDLELWHSDSPCWLLCACVCVQAWGYERAVVQQCRTTT